MIWYGMVWYGMVCCGIGSGMVYYGAAWPCAVCNGLVRYGMVRYGKVRCGMLRYVLIWYGAVCPNKSHPDASRSRTLLNIGKTNKQKGVVVWSVSLANTWLISASFSPRESGGEINIPPNTPSMRAPTP